MFGLGRRTDNRKPSETYRPFRYCHERACLKRLRDPTPDLFKQGCQSWPPESLAANADD